MQPAREAMERLSKTALLCAQMTNQFFTSLKERDKKEAVMVQKINKELIPYGWVFSPSLPVFSIERIYLQLEDKGVEEVVEIITNYFSEQTCKEIIESICSMPEFYARSEIIKDAFRDHCERKYTLSIPIFLAQAEGAFIDHFERKLYEKRKKRYLKRNVSSLKSISIIVESFETFIRDVLAKTYSVKDKIPEEIFARHLILHGRSTDYGTRENSIRAILLLDYVSFIISLQPRIETI